MPDFLDHNKFCENLPEIESTKIFSRRKFHPEGLFSEQIFGPIQNYTCQCDIYHGPSREGNICEDCGVLVLESRTRREKFAKISLPIQVINPIFYDMLKEIGKSSVVGPLDELIKNESSILFLNEDGYYVIDTEGNSPDNVKVWERLDAVYELVRGVSEKDYDKDYRWKHIYDNLDKLLINEIIVLPPELRPSSSKTSINELDEINRYYMQILTKKEVMQNTLVNIQRDKQLFYQYFRQLQKNVNDLYEQILAKLSKKEGLIRGHILGKRIDFSGRAVIAPGPDLEIDCCKIPYIMYLELFKLEVSKKLIELGKFKLLNNAIEFVEECIKYENLVLFDLCKELIQTNKDICILNRQPSLHRLSMVGLYVDISLEHVIRLHPLACEELNADFDGDVIAIYVPITEESKKEVKSRFLMSKNISVPSSDELILTPRQDMVLGIYSLTNNLFEDGKEKVEYKGTEITKNRMLFNQCFPEDFRVIDEPVDKKKLLNILEEIRQTYSVNTIKKVLDEIKRTGFKYASLFGTTMSLDKFEVGEVDKVKDEIYSQETIQEQLKRSQSEEIIDMLRNQFHYAYMIDSGARGSWDQVKQVNLTRGFISNFKGKILEEPIKNSLIEGLTEKEFFNSTYGCRKGLLDVAVNTGASGYLSRKLIMSMANLQLDYQTKDCGTKDTLKVYVEDEKKAKMLVKRYYVEDDELKEINKENYKELIGKVIQLRSPIYCQNDKICNTCYGFLETDSQYIGIIAAQSLGERGTQLVLQTFHTSLRQNTKILDVNMNSYRIDEVYDMVKSRIALYTFSCSPEGRIEVSKIIDAHKDRFENKIVRVTLDNGEYIDCTLDHEWIMRDGSRKEAKDLEVNDSVMPIYEGNEEPNQKAIIKFAPTALDKLDSNHKITNIEFIELDDYEEFYDLTVDSKYHNFALGSGIFIHNSGVASTGGSDDMEQHDIVGGLSRINKLLHSEVKSHNHKELVDNLYKIYDEAGDILHIHFECLVAQLMWKGDYKWRTLSNRNEVTPEHCSIQTAPEKESWLLSLAFSNPRKAILKGILNSGKYSGIFDKILCGKKLDQ